MAVSLDGNLVSRNTAHEGSVTDEYVRISAAIHVFLGDGHSSTAQRQVIYNASLHTFYTSRPKGRTLFQPCNVVGERWETDPRLRSREGAMARVDGQAKLDCDYHDNKDEQSREVGDVFGKKIMEGGLSRETLGIHGRNIYGTNERNSTMIVKSSKERS